MERDHQYEVVLSGQQVSSYDKADTHCWRLPVAKLYTEVDVDHYIRKAEAKRREAQNVSTDAASPFA